MMINYSGAWIHSETIFIVGIICHVGHSALPTLLPYLIVGKLMVKLSE